MIITSSFNSVNRNVIGNLFIDIACLLILKRHKLYKMRLMVEWSDLYNSVDVHNTLGLANGILLAVPIPTACAIDKLRLDSVTLQALSQAE